MLTFLYAITKLYSGENTREQKIFVWLKVDCMIVWQCLFNSKLPIYHPHGMLFSQFYCNNHTYTRLNFPGTISHCRKQNRVKVEYWQNCQALELVTSKRLYDDYKKDTCTVVSNLKIPSHVIVKPSVPKCCSCFIADFLSICVKGDLYNNFKIFKWRQRQKLFSISCKKMPGTRHCTKPRDQHTLWKNPGFHP